MEERKKTVLSVLNCSPFLHNNLLCIWASSTEHTFIFQVTLNFMKKTTTECFIMRHKNLVLECMGHLNLHTDESFKSSDAKSFIFVFVFYCSALGNSGKHGFFLLIQKSDCWGIF